MSNPHRAEHGSSQIGSSLIIGALISSRITKEMETQADASSLRLPLPFFLSSFRSGESASAVAVAAVGLLFDDEWTAATAPPYPAENSQPLESGYRRMQLFSATLPKAFTPLPAQFLPVRPSDSQNPGGNRQDQ